MTQIIVQHPFTAQLHGLAGPVEIIDEDGRRLGHFVPTTGGNVNDNCPYTDEELQQMRAEQGGRSLSEIWRSLGVR